MAEAEGAPPARWPGAAESMVLGYAWLALISAIAIALGLSLPSGGALVRAQHHVFDALPTLGLGVLHGLLVWLVRDRLRLPTPAALALAAALAAPILASAVSHEMRRQACVLFGGRFEGPLFVAFLVLASLAVPAAHVVGAFFQRWRFGPVLPVTVAVAAMGVDHAVMRDDYAGVHAVVGWVAAVLAGASLARAGARLRAIVASKGRALRLGLLALGAASLLSVALPPPNRVRIELFRSPVAPAAWVSAAVFWPAPSPSPSQASAPLSPGWLPEGEAPPTSPPLLPPEKAPVVVLVTIDSLRADVLERADAKARFPALARMAERGASFSRAVSPGSQTSVSLSSVFSGRYFSQLEFGLFGEGPNRFAYPAADPTPRFPALLGEAGVRTSSYCSLAFLGDRFGVLRGFSDPHMLVQGRRHGLARELVGPLLDGLRRVGNAPAFFYVHLMEPHFPYDRGAKEGPAFERYLSEVSVADSHVARIARLLSQRLPGRGYLFVTSDHGEAFGEHGTTHHTKTLYEELLRVPVLVTGPGVVPGRIEERVSLVDLGPTILDLFGLPAPAHAMGETWVPLLAGRERPRTRPVFAEGRLRRAHWGRGNIKVIEDLRRKTVEAYDLERDPGERQNLWDAGDPRAAEALAAMRAFFEATVEEGYEPPYKP